MKFICLITMLAALCFSPSRGFADSRDVGEISTVFKLIGPNHKIVVSAFDDPKVRGVTCYVARPKTGGIKGGLGLAEDPSIASVSCVQTGPISFTKKIDSDESGEEVFDESRSLIFKSLNINRLYDKENGNLVYVVRTHRVIEGSPTTSISVVPPISWNGIEPEKPILK